MRRFKLLLVVAAMIGLGVGCAYIPLIEGFVGGKLAEREATSTSYKVGAGPVNNWHKDVSWAETLKPSGLGIAHIEFFPWASGIMEYEKVAEAYKKLVAICKRDDLILFVSLTNDNQGKGKYGDTLKPLGNYLSQIKAAADFIKDVTDCKLWLQPVGENYGNANAIEEYCASIFPKEMLVNNGNGGRPSGTVSWSSMFAWHPANTGAKPPQGAIVVSDHSGILSQLYGSQWQFGGTANNTLIGTWTGDMLTSGAKAVILYDFGGKKATPEAYKLMAIAAGVEFKKPTIVIPEDPDDPHKPVRPIRPPDSRDEIDLSTVTWDHTDVSGWPITHTVTITKFTKDRITWKYDSVPKWDAKDGLHANPWIIANIGGKWRAATWEWLRPGQSDKNMGGDKTFGNHIKKSAWPSDWDPAKGETVYFFVSGLARDSKRNSKERTNVIKVVVE